MRDFSINKSKTTWQRLKKLTIRNFLKSTKKVSTAEVKFNPKVSKSQPVIKLKHEKYLVLQGVMEYLISFKIPMRDFDEVEPGQVLSNETRQMVNSGTRIETNSDRKQSNLFSRNSPEKDNLNEEFDIVTKRIKLSVGNPASSNQIGKPENQQEQQKSGANIDSETSAQKIHSPKSYSTALAFPKIKNKQNLQEINSTLEDVI